MINLSIIIPIGRHENDFKLIKQIKQKFKGCEIILVIDEENKIIAQEKIEVDQLYLLRNSSRAKALNKGINLSTRDILWLLHLDSDIKNISPSDLELLSTCYGNRGACYNSLGELTYVPVTIDTMGMPQTSSVSDTEADPVVSITNLNLNLRPLNVPLAKLLNPPKVPDAVCEVATCI